VRWINFCALKFRPMRTMDRGAIVHVALVSTQQRWRHHADPAEIPGAGTAVDAACGRA
jgi:hypothetical protein